MLTREKVQLSQVQRVLHEVASASLLGFLIVLPFAVVFTSMFFFMMNRSLTTSTVWNNVFSCKNIQKKREYAVQLSDELLYIKKKSYKHRKKLFDATQTQQRKKNSCKLTDTPYRDFHDFIVVNELNLKMISSTTLSGLLKARINNQDNEQNQKKYNPFLYISEKGHRLNLYHPDYFPYHNKKKYLVTLSKFSKKRVLFFVISTQSKTACKNCTFTKAYIVFSIELSSSKKQKKLHGSLRIALVPNYARESQDIIWSKKKHQLVFFDQMQMKIQLWPTRTPNEPKDAGRWVIHTSQKLLKSYKHTELLPEKKKQLLAQKFIGAMLHTLFVNKNLSTTLVSQNQWITFFNGVDQWGLIQWMSTLIAMIAFLMLVARFWIVSSETKILLYWSYQNPNLLKKNAQKEQGGIIYDMRQEASYNKTELPQPRLIAAMNLLDEKYNKTSEYVQVRMESSRRVVEFLVNSLASIGFIGTITGIAFAIGEAYKVVTPDELMRLQAIKNLSSNLSLAFSTTFVALVLTLVCDAIAKRLWRKEDQMLETFVQLEQTWCWTQGNSLLEQAQNSLIRRDKQFLPEEKEL